ncbi:MAG: GNAT family N-acetyltransferase [Acidobacteriota bacterium]
MTTPLDPELNPSPGPAVSIRPATEADVPQILHYIHELAAYENLSHQVEATEELLRQNLFGPSVHGEVVFAEVDGVDVGFALFFHTFSTFLGQSGIYLEDLFVKPESRGRGVGTVLLRYLAKLAVERGCGRLEWVVLDWNSSAIRFYEGLGASCMDGWTTFRLDGAALAELGAAGAPERA